MKTSLLIVIILLGFNCASAQETAAESGISASDTFQGYKTCDCEKLSAPDSTELDELAGENLENERKIGISKIESKRKKLIFDAAETGNVPIVKYVSTPTILD